ncbi:RNA exonuclease 1-like [Holothuria leucospilota]|uniref:RNA exonuclease 1-like n=1 Tax=Holothuria leucospilota TaxID=206669 RepID=A0A9Q1HCS4_HOLLE|nr:RNA exonuclease 1-like [Holothuria leucospilota]
MFSSSNFFKGLDCPFYEKGPGCCKRPYCHFRHVRKELPETDNGGDIPLQSNVASKEPVQLSYRALPSVQKSSSRHSSRHHQYHRDKKSKVHVKQKSKPQSQFSYIPTPLAQLTKLNQQKDAQGEDSEELPVTPNLETESQELSETSVTAGEKISEIGSLLLEEKKKMEDSVTESGVVTKSDTGGLEPNKFEEESKVSFPDTPLQIVADQNVSHSSQDASSLRLENLGIGLSTSSSVASCSVKDSKVPSDSVISSGCYEEFVALQKQEINRIEAQLAELAKQKKLAEQSLQMATVEKAGTQGSTTAGDPPKFPVSPPSMVKQEESMGKHVVDIGCSQHGSSGPQASDADVKNKYTAEAESISEEYDPMSNYTAAASNQEEIAAFLKEARRKSNEKKESAVPLTYVPTAISAPVDPPEEEVDSEPEGAFSSSDAEDHGQQEQVELSDSDEEEQSKSQVKNTDSGFSESFKDASGLFEELDKPKDISEKTSKEKANKKRSDSLNKVEKVKRNVVKTPSPANKDLSDKKKVVSKSSNEKKEKIQQPSKESKGSAIGGEKKKISSSDLSSFFEKRHIVTSSKIFTNGSSPQTIDRASSTKASISSQKKKAVASASDRKIRSEKHSESKAKLVKRLDQPKEPDLYTGKIEKSKKIMKKVSLKQQKDNLAPKPIKNQGKDDNFKTKLQKLTLKEVNAKRKLSQLFGDDSSNDSDDSGPEFNLKLPETVTISSDSDGKMFPQNTGKSKVLKKNQHAHIESSTKRDFKRESSLDVFRLSSDSESGTFISNKSQTGKAMQKIHPSKPKNFKHANAVSKKSDKKVENSSQLNSSSSSKSKQYHKDVKKKLTQPAKTATGSVVDLDQSSNCSDEEFDPTDDEIVFITEEDDYIKQSREEPVRDVSQKLSDGKKRPSERKPPVPTKKVRMEEKIEQEKLSPKQEEQVSDSSGDDDFEPVEDLDLESFHYDSDDVKDSDPYEECLKIFNENWNVIPPDEQKKKVMEIQNEMRKDEEQATQSSKRHAHTPKFDTRKVRKLTKRTKALPTPSQICHQRFMDAQKAALEKASKKKEEEEKSFLKKSSQKRISHFDEHRQQNGQGSRISHSSKALKLKQKTLAMTASKDSRRVAHVPAKVSKRPILPTEYGSKVSSNIRQRYLNLFIDELLKTCKTEKVAFDKALAEEKEVYDRASSRSIYLNLSVNTLKRLRRDGTTPQPAASSSNRFAVSHQAVLGGKAATLTTYTLHRNYPQKSQKLEGLVLYEKLKQYLATEEQLIENGYPRPSEESGKAVIKAAEKTKSSDPNQQVCCRCGKTFLRRPNGKYITKEICVHHWGKLWTKKIAGALESRYSCCSGDVQASGCSIAKYHVTDDKVVNSSGFMTTMAKSPPLDGNPGVYALDCEMCYTTMGVELTRVTVISDKMERVYDSLVKPSNEVVDYNTKFSGITEEDLEYVKTTLQNVQAVLLSMFSSDTILIGHSLESDLLALKLIHSTVIDTALVFPHRRGPPYKRALRTLTAEYLQKLIQDDESGHDSMEDARSCMELMVYKVKQDAKLRSQRR